MNEEEVNEDGDEVNGDGDEVKKDGDEAKEAGFYMSPNRARSLSVAW